MSRKQAQSSRHVPLGKPKDFDKVPGYGAVRGEHSLYRVTESYDVEGYRHLLSPETQAALEERGL